MKKLTPTWLFLLLIPIVCFASITDEYNEALERVKSSMDQEGIAAVIEEGRGDYEAVLDSLSSASDKAWVTFKGKYVGLYLQVKDVKQMKDPMIVIRFFDEVYKHQKELVGSAPFDGKMIFFQPVKSEAKAWYMLSGNPIIYKEEGNKDLINLSNQKDASMWGFIHEMGHNFSWVAGVDYIADALVEDGANIFTLYVWDHMKVPPHDNASEYMNNAIKWWREERKKEKIKSEVWLFLGLVMTVQKDYGWEPFKFMYRKAKEKKYKISNWNERWDFWVRSLSEGAGVNLTSRFSSWGCEVSESLSKELSLKLKPDTKWKEWEKWFDKQANMPKFDSRYRRVGAHLFSPLNRYLQIGSKETFRIKIPGAKSVAVLEGDDWHFLQKKEDDIFQKEIEITHGDKDQKFYIVAKLSDTGGYGWFITYTVVKPGFQPKHTVLKSAEPVAKPGDLPKECRHLDSEEIECATCTAFIAMLKENWSEIAKCYEIFCEKKCK